MNELLVCCNPCGCTQDIEADENMICIISIICLTIFFSVLFFLLFQYMKSNKRIELEKEKRQLEKNLSEKANELQKEKGKNKEVDSTLLNKEKKAKDFLDYCYKMAKSLEKGNEKQKEDCWKILLHNHAECIPDELKKEYKVGKTE